MLPNIASPAKVRDTRCKVNKVPHSIRITKKAPSCNGDAHHLFEVIKSKKLISQTDTSDIEIHPPFSARPDPVDKVPGIENDTSS